MAWKICDDRVPWEKRISTAAEASATRSTRSTVRIGTSSRTNGSASIASRRANHSRVGACRSPPVAVGPSDEVAFTNAA